MSTKTPLGQAFERVRDASAATLAAMRAHTIAERNFSRLRWSDDAPMDLIIAAENAVAAADKAWAEAAAAETRAAEHLLTLAQR